MTDARAPLPTSEPYWSLEDVVSQDDAVRGHRAFLMRELDAIPLHPPLHRFLQRWQSGDPAAYLGEMWAP